MDRFKINVALKKAAAKRPNKISLTIKLKPKYHTIYSHPNIGNVIVTTKIWNVLSDRPIFINYRYIEIIFNFY